MATYSESDKNRMLRYPIVSVLHILGKRTDHRGCLYFSPFRDESSPSMHINAERNIWNDFGEGSGGNVFTLVSRLKGFKGGEAWDFLAGLDNVIVPQETFRPHYSHKSSRIITDEIGTSITSGYLVRYAASRGIPENILQRYCSQVQYHIEGYPSSRFTAIGFPAGDEGWVLRMASENPHCKRCTSAGFTSVTQDGEFRRTASSENVEVFEGFFDFLSWQTLRGGLVPGCDVCVLNSVTNVDRAMEYILSHENIGCWLDNDAAGREAFSRIMSKAENCIVTDHSPELGGCKDVNEYLRSLPATIEHEQYDNNVRLHSLTL